MDQVVHFIENNITVILGVGIPGILILSGVTKLLKLICIVVACIFVVGKLLAFY